MRISDFPLSFWEFLRDFFFLSLFILCSSSSFLLSFFHLFVPVPLATKYIFPLSSLHFFKDSLFLFYCFVLFYFLLSFFLPFFFLFMIISSLPPLLSKIIQTSFPLCIRMFCIITSFFS